MDRAQVISSKIKNDLTLIEETIVKTLVGGEKRLGETALATLKAGGKRLRPALLLIAGQVGSYDLEKLVPAAAAVELIHMASLVHDDILDGAETRRGIPTVNSLWGDQIAVTTGDFLFAHAFVLLAKIGEPRVTDLACSAALALSLGELHQMQTAFKSDQSLNDYLSKIFNKTAILFSASCEIGALLSGASVDEIRRLAEYGENLGMAFQIYDDILDIEGRTDELGKPIGIDLKDGTMTMPIIYALEETGGDTRLCSVIENTAPSEREVDDAIQLILSTNAIERTKREARKYAQLAIDAVKHISSKEAQTDLTAIGKFVVARYN